MTTQAKNNAVGWFEIPTANMDRAIAFYEAVFKVTLERNKIGDLEMAWFPWAEYGMGASGSLIHDPEHFKPSTHGVIVYFTAHSGDLANELSRVEAAGGKVIQPKTLITEEIGYFALIHDSEGNRIALHSRK